MKFFALALFLASAPALRAPAEYEPQAAVWLAWPTYENVAGKPSAEVTLAIARALAGHTTVLLAVNDAAEAARARARLGADPGDVRLITVPHADLWLRDTGGLFLTGREGPRVVDFRFNGWGYGPRSAQGRASAEIDGITDRAIAAAHGIPTVRSSMIMEGGALELTGDGTLLTTESVVFQRNPGWTRPLFESEARRVLGVSRVVWLARGVPEDDLSFDGRLADGSYTVITTGGHIDEFARAAAPDQILLAEVSAADAASDPVAAEARRRLEENRARLERARTADGRAYRIVRMPVPLPLHETMRKGDGVFDFLAGLSFKDPRDALSGAPIPTLMATSYLNYLVSNGVVVGQRYWKPGRPLEMARRDARAKAGLEAAYPGRHVVLVDAEAVNLGGGGVHCITREVPAGTPIPSGR